MVDLTDRKNIKIIEAEKSTILDDEIEIFRQQLKYRSQKAEEFHKYLIQKELETNKKISDEDFENKMKKIIKQQKILKSLLKQQGKAEKDN